MEQQSLLPDDPPEITGRAYFSDCGQYRYMLTRDWAHEKGTAVFIMLNPSTADEKEDDPTIRRCIGFAKRWGYGRIEVVNLFAWRATNPADLKKALDPIGVKNDAHIFDACDFTGPVIGGIVIAAWGAHGGWNNRDNQVLGMLAQHDFPVHYLTLTKDGKPRHPLYLKNDLTPIPWI